MTGDSKNLKTKMETVVPGDRLATIEEFVPGNGAASIGDSVVATLVGDAEPDMSSRVMNVHAVRNADNALPKVGDFVIGLVDSAQSSVAQITIIAINDNVSDKELSGMLSLREDRRRRSTPVKAGDILRAKVISTKNSIYHLGLEGPESGVVKTVCSNCGGEVIAMGKDRIKCKECGFVDERLLADDFIRYSRGQARAPT